MKRKKKKKKSDQHENIESLNIWREPENKRNLREKWFVLEENKRIKRFLGFEAEFYLFLYKIIPFKKIWWITFTNFFMGLIEYNFLISNIYIYILFFVVTGDLHHCDIG